MMSTALHHHPAIEWSVASRALAGQSVSGDLHAVIPWREGVLIAVIDGLGHGEEATAAARAAVEVLEKHAGESVDALMQRCHRALQTTRGAVMTLVSINTRQQTATMIGVGNVETVLLRANPEARPPRETVFLRGGVVGYKLPPLHVEARPVGAGDVLVFATDGVRDDFAEGLSPADPLPQLVERIIGQKLRGTDDGLVLACKYVGARERESSPHAT